MKQKLFFTCLLIVNSVWGSPIFQYKLSKSQKLESTFSAKLENSRTLHFAIVKNSDTKNYELLPFLVSSDRKVKQLDAFSGKKIFNILSYHSNGNIFSIVDYNEATKKINVVDFDLGTGKNKSVAHDMKLSPDNLFQLKDKTVLVTLDKLQSAFHVKVITDAEHFERIRFDIPDEKMKLARNFFSEPPEVLNQHEFVEFGSIKKRKAYAIDEVLTYTMADETDTKVLQFNLATKDWSNSTVAPEMPAQTKDIGSYLYRNIMAYWFVTPSDAALRFLDVNSNLPLKQMSISADADGVISKQALQEYIDASLKSSTRSTITINGTKDGKLALRLGNVNTKTYRYTPVWYSNTWFFMFMQTHMMMMQMHQQAVMGMHGPSAGECIFIVEEKRLPHLDLVLNADLSLATNQTIETTYQNIDREAYASKYEEMRHVKNFSSEFTDDEMRYIYQDNKTKEIIIDTEKL